MKRPNLPYILSGVFLGLCVVVGICVGAGPSTLPSSDAAIETLRASLTAERLAANEKLQGEVGARKRAEDALRVVTGERDALAAKLADRDKPPATPAAAVKIGRVGTHSAWLEAPIDGQWEDWDCTWDMGDGRKVVGPWVGYAWAEPGDKAVSVSCVNVVDGRRLTAATKVKIAGVTGKTIQLGPKDKFPATIEANTIVLGHRSGVYDVTRKPTSIRGGNVRLAAWGDGPGPVLRHGALAFDGMVSDCHDVTVVGWTFQGSKDPGDRPANIHWDGWSYVDCRFRDLGSIVEQTGRTGSYITVVGCVQETVILRHALFGDGNYISYVGNKFPFGSQGENLFRDMSPAGHHLLLSGNDLSQRKWDDPRGQKATVTIRGGSTVAIVDNAVRVAGISVGSNEMPTRDLLVAGNRSPDSPIGIQPGAIDVTVRDNDPAGHPVAVGFGHPGNQPRGFEDVRVSVARGQVVEVHADSWPDKAWKNVTINSGAKVVRINGGKTYPIQEPK